MTHTELNEYLLHYATKDKTQRAIMLTAPWGTGKSYYIQNELTSYFTQQGNYEPVVVSLYGMKTLYDLSKAIFIECNAKFLKSKDKSFSKAKYAATTILKGVTSRIGIDILNEENLQQLFDSANLADKLLILEDIERSGIDILEVLGYVNNLVEQDEVKVLLVANEDEIKENLPASVKQKYLVTKEKSISDTITFEGDFPTAINQIIGGFENDCLSSISSNGGLDEICNVCRSNGITNLRTFVFACQKAADIFQKTALIWSNDEDYIKTVFYGILVFSQKIKQGEKIVWKDEASFSVSLGTEKYPLFRSCYDYIAQHSYDVEKVDSEKAALKTIRLYSKYKSSGDADLQTLYNFWVSTEKDVLSAIQSITERLKNENDISFFEYGRLAVYLVYIRSVIDCDIEEAKNLLINNLHNKGSQIEADYLFTTIMPENKNSDAFKEFESLKENMTKSLMGDISDIFSFDYLPSNIASFRESILANEGQFIRSGSFFSRLDVNKVVEMLKECSANNILDLRRIFLSIYGTVNIRDFLSADKASLEELKRKVDELHTFNNFDKIQRKQIEYLSDNLLEIINKL